MIPVAAGVVLVAAAFGLGLALLARVARRRLLQLDDDPPDL